MSNCVGTRLLDDPSEVGHLDRATINWLLSHSVPTSAIAFPLAIRSGRVVFDPHGNRYKPNRLGEFAFIVPVMADPTTTILDFEVVDYVAWSPRSGQIATRLGQICALGEEQIGIDGTGTTGLPIAVHRSPLGWFRSERRGIVIADWKIAPYALSSLILGAEDDEHRAELLRRLTPIPPTIIVSSQRRAA